MCNSELGKSHRQIYKAEIVKLVLQHVKRPPLHIVATEKVLPSR